MRLVLTLGLVVVVTSGASAQSPYVGASLIGDVVRVSGPREGGMPGGGEAFGGALRVGAPLGDRWGVELELARTGELESPEPIIRGQLAGFTFTSDDPLPQLFPFPRIESERQLSTLSTLLWWSHDLNQRVSLAYLGGVAFTRSDWEISYSFPDFIVPPGPMGRPITVPRSFEQETTSYDADVAVGIEGRIGMTEHLRLVPGLRLQTAAGGWAIRPGIGVHWTF